MPDADAPTPPRGEGGDAPGEGPSRDGQGREGQGREGKGLLSRLIGALNPPPDREDEAPRHASAPTHSLGPLRRMRVEDVAVPKSDIVAVPDSIALPDLVEVFRGSGRTRVPVHEGSLDRPLGVVNLKDVALRHGFGSAAPFDLRALLRPILYVPPSMPLAVLLQRMQAERVHIALVIDEYGGTDGLCTIEDLLETVVGEIDDEHDAAEPQPLERQADGSWTAQGSAPIEALERVLGLNLTAHEEIDAEEVDTLGGLVFYLAGHVPAPGEVVEHPDGPRFEVLDADARRIRRLRVTVPAGAEG